MKYIFKYGAIHTENLLTPEEIKDNEKVLGRLQGLIERRGFIKVDNRTKVTKNGTVEEDEENDD